MPLGHVAHRGGQEVDVPLDLVGDLRAGEHRHPRGGELDAERHALDEPADAERLQALRRRRGRSPVSPAPPARRRAGAHALPSPFSVETEPVDVEHPFALHVESFARGRQELDSRGSLDQFAEQAGAVDQVLEVVEHEQGRALAQVVEQLLLRREAAVRASTANWIASATAGARSSGAGDGDERHEVHAVRVALDPPCRGLEREPRLARLRPGRRASAGGTPDPRAAGRSPRAPSHGRRTTCPVQGRLFMPDLERLQKREVARQPVDLELVDLLGRAQILEAVRPEVADVCVHERTSRAARAEPAPHGRPRRSVRPCGRRDRRSPPRSAAARPCADPCAPGSGPSASAR